MKLLLKLIVLFSTLFFISCKETKTGFMPVKTIDLSDLGNINAIRAIDNQLYILDASYSTLYRINSSKPVKILTVPVEHRAFLLDFAIKENRVWFVNTYDEIFVTDLSGMMQDTIKVSRPDKIMLADNRVFITERFPTGSSLKLIAISDSTEEILSPEIADYSPAKAGDCNLSFQDKIWLSSASKQQLFKLDSDNLFTAYKLESSKTATGFHPGRFYLRDNYLLCLGYIGSKNYLALCRVNDNTVTPLNITELPQEIDISISEITADKIYLYDYLNKQIMVYNWPEI